MDRQSRCIDRHRRISAIVAWPFTVMLKTMDWPGIPLSTAINAVGDRTIRTMPLAQWIAACGSRDFLSKLLVTSGLLPVSFLRRLASANDSDGTAVCSLNVQAIFMVKVGRTGKECHATKAHALSSLIRRKLAIFREAPGKISAYRCDYCRHWHTGHQ
jgi:hypothetical protein